MGRLKALLLSLLFAFVFSFSWGFALWCIWEDLGLFVGGAAFMYSFRWLYQSCMNREDPFDFGDY